MDQNKYVKIGALVFFLILAAYSCWATTHSLHLLMPQIPELLVWGITIAFFFLASYATKMIVDSLNQNIYLENRKASLILGIMMVVVFWLLCSMPTNTHTFFYNTKIGDVVTQDINETSKYLICIANREVTDPAFDAVKKQVDSLKAAMNNEFNGKGTSGKKGNGENVSDYLTQINNILGSNIPMNINYNKHDVKILNGYNDAINRALDAVKRDKYQASSDAVQHALLLIEDLDVMADTVQSMVNAGKIYEDIIKQTEGVLQNGYSHIKSNSKFVDFGDNSKDKELYTAENLVTRTKRMLSVYDVWVDFLAGKYAGDGFLFWVLISILVDLGAFICFDLAFKKEEY